MSEPEQRRVCLSGIDATVEGQRLVTPIAKVLLGQVAVDAETTEAIFAALGHVFETAVRWTMSELIAQLIEAGIDARIAVEWDDGE